MREILTANGGFRAEWRLVKSCCFTWLALRDREPGLETDRRKANDGASAERYADTGNIERRQ